MATRPETLALGRVLDDLVRRAHSLGHSPDAIQGWPQALSRPEAVALAMYLGWTGSSAWARRYLLPKLIRYYRNALGPRRGCAVYLLPRKAKWHLTAHGIRWGGQGILEGLSDEVPFGEWRSGKLNWGWTLSPMSLVRRLVLETPMGAEVLSRSWALTEDRGSEAKFAHLDRCAALGLSPDTPEGIVLDALRDAGLIPQDG